MGNNHCNKLLIGQKAIREYLHDISLSQLHQFCSWGMPAAVINGRWYAWTDNIDDFFKRLTLNKITEFHEEDETGPFSEK